ncbi:MAG TPA: Crp/Fnr family transcriptional regulator [Polyangiaceae bacterium]|nr:Crp/Fnr family transcriptional regulator [Polyangiaceae bacterium]
MSLIHVLQRTPSLAGVEQADLARMASFAGQKTLRRGVAVWQAGDLPQALTVIRNGLVKILRVGGNGRVSLCGLFGAPESIGDVMLIRATPYPASAVVATDTASLVTIPRELVLECLAKCPELAVSLTCSIQRKLTTLHDKIEILGAGSVEARLATALLKLHAEFGDELADGSFTIPVALSRRELAELVSTAFETVVRTMCRWEHAGVLSTTDRGFTLHDLAALRVASGIDVPSSGESARET